MLGLAVIVKYNGSQRCIKPASPQETVTVCTVLLIDLHELLVELLVELLELSIVMKRRDEHISRVPQPDPVI